MNDKTKSTSQIYDTVLVTGDRGYLMGPLMDYLKIYFHNVTVLPKDWDIANPYYFNYLKANLQTIDCIIHFASPSDSLDFENKIKMNHTMIDGTINLIKLADYFQSKFIFASSMAVEDTKDVMHRYGSFKLAMENYLIGYDNLDKLILRIPRVYDKSRDKGLIKKLKDNTFNGSEDMIIDDIITLPKFLLQTKSMFDSFFHHPKPLNFGIYTNLDSLTIKQIRDKILN